MDKQCFLREVPQPWPSSSRWTQPRADCRVRSDSYHVGQRLHDSGCTTTQGWVFVWSHCHRHYGFGSEHWIAIELFLGRDAAKMTHVWTEMLATFMSPAGPLDLDCSLYFCLCSSFRVSAQSYCTNVVLFPVSVDEKRKSKSTPLILAEIAKEEGPWVQVSLWDSIHVQFGLIPRWNNRPVTIDCLDQSCSVFTPCAPFSLSLYRGWLPVISSLCCSNFVYFYTFNTLKKMTSEGGKSRPGKDLLMGVVSGLFTTFLKTKSKWLNTAGANCCVDCEGAVNVILTTPMWVVNTRLKLQGVKFRNEDLRETHYRGIFGLFTFQLLLQG